MDVNKESQKTSDMKWTLRRTVRTVMRQRAKTVIMIAIKEMYIGELRELKKGRERKRIVLWKGNNTVRINVEKGWRESKEYSEEMIENL